MGYFDGRSMHIYLDGLIILIEEVCTYILMGYIHWWVKHFDGRGRHRYIDGLIILMKEVCTDNLMS